MLVLGLETSCDDTAVAVYDSECGLKAHLRASQVEIHQAYGGVVPELAARDHIRKLMPLIEAVIQQADIDRHALDAIAYTKGPGLSGALLVGASVGRSLAFSLNIPAIGVHHMEGHLLSPMLEDEPPSFPFIALLVSGGHTLLVKVDGFSRYQLLGQTRDDAVGEAFDKTAKLMGLAYPGGPEIAQLATHGDASRFPMPRPMTDRPGLDFSFSGLKTHVRTLYQASENPEDDKADIAAGFQQAVIDTLLIKCKRALKQTGAQRLVIAGGVSANQALRDQMAEKLPAQVFYPRHDFCTDNGAMIAYTGWLRLKHGVEEALSFDVKPRWPLDELSSVNAMSSNQ